MRRGSVSVFIADVWEAVVVGEGIVTDLFAKIEISTPVCLSVFMYKGSKSLKVTAGMITSGSYISPFTGSVNLYFTGFAKLKSWPSMFIVKLAVYAGSTSGCPIFC